MIEVIKSTSLSPEQKLIMKIVNRKKKWFIAQTIGCSRGSLRAMEKKGKLYSRLNNDTLELEYFKTGKRSL